MHERMKIAPVPLVLRDKVLKHNNRVSHDDDGANIVCCLLISRRYSSPSYLVRIFF